MMRQCSLHDPILRRQGFSIQARRGGKPWTHAEDDLAVRLRNDKLTYPEIAEQLPGRSVKAVGARIVKLLSPYSVEHPGRRSFAKTDDDLMLHLRDAGHRVNEVASHSPERNEQVVEERLRQLLRRNGSPQTRKTFVRFTASEDAQIKALKEAGLTNSQSQSRMPHRNAGSLSYRWNHHLKPKEQLIAVLQNPLSDAEVLPRINDEGHTFWNIAEATGASYKSVRWR